MTIALIDRILALATVPPEDIPADIRRMAALSLFDWSAVARAGADEEASRIIRTMVLEESGAPAASVIGAVQKVPTRAAALANGAISHALDYDDTHFAHIGHLSVAVTPAALAVAELRDLPVGDLLTACLLGAEAAIQVGLALGQGHYERGFHQTATSGAFGAAVAAGRLLNLRPEQMRQAIGLVSTRAAGLKSQFGTMGKPYNAGTAAANGVEAALLAARGFTSCDDGLEDPQGFLATHGAGPYSATPDDGAFRYGDIRHKLHACCHGTHAMIEAMLNLRGQVDLRPAEVAQISVKVHPRWLKVCDIKHPRTGLEVKFSYAYLAAMVVAGRSTAALTSYRDEACADPVLRDLAARVSVHGDATLADTAAAVTVETGDGHQEAAQFDLAATLPLDQVERRLRNKAVDLLGERSANLLWQAIHSDPNSPARRLGDLLAAPI